MLSELFLDFAQEFLINQLYVLGKALLIVQSMLLLAEELVVLLNLDFMEVLQGQLERRNMGFTLEKDLSWCLHYLVL